MSALYELRRLRLQRGARDVLTIDALTLPAGGITAVIGPNGAGKSTLFETLAFLHAPADGELVFDGEPVTPVLRAAFRPRVGLVPQQPYLFDRSVLDNVLLALRIRGVTGRAAHARAMDTFAALDITALAGRHARALSGGESQKVALARTLALHPEVLLLDEPFTYLDPVAISELAAVLRRGAELGVKGVLFTGHDEFVALRLADRIVNVMDGQAVEDSLLNLYDGQLDAVHHTFETGRLRFQVPDHATRGSRAVLDPAHVVISRARFESSMQNNLPGRITDLREHGGDVLLTVDAGERIHARLSHRAVATGGYSVGSRVWVCFKSSAVRVF